MKSNKFVNLNEEVETETGLTSGEIEIVHDLKFSQVAISPTARGISDIFGTMEPE